VSKGSSQPGLLSVIFLSVGTMIGSGWLFAAYYASKTAGSASILSWIIGAVLVLFMALLLSEIAIKHPVNGLFTRLISISHNTHFGFVTAISNWLLGLIVVPSEAIASTQYLASMYPPLTPYLFADGLITMTGLGLAAIFMIFYLFVNFWGIRLLSKVNNVITWVKVIVPVSVAVVIMIAAFDSGNFTAYKDSFMPYGATSVFAAIVSSGIFYSFFGFQAAASFTSELPNPKRNIPIALVSSVLIVLAIYLLLQVSFIGALPSEMVTNGWASLNFDSPLAQLAGLLGLNFLVVILYADAFVSPSGTGLLYLGLNSRQLNEMVKHKQMPKAFGSRDRAVNFSRRALILTFICSLVLVFFFRNWQLIASLTTTFIVISCMALPVAYDRMRRIADELPVKLLPCSRMVAFLVFLCLSYFLLISGTKNLVVAFALIFVFFVCYALSVRPENKMRSLMIAFGSSWGIFCYLLFVIIYGVIGLYLEHDVLYYLIYIIISAVFYLQMINQKPVNDK
jgi:amino acid transporter